MGARIDETPLPGASSDLVAQGRASVTPVCGRRDRRKVYRKLPFGAIPGYAPLCFDSNDPKTVESAFLMRLMRTVPKADPTVLARLESFVDDFLRRNVPKVEPMEFEDWLASTSYDELRKAALRAEHEALLGGRPSKRRASHVKSFVKTESYPEWKYPRMINSRCDTFKAYSGRFFKAIEEAVYKLPYFIKHTPVPERPRVVDALRRSGSLYYETDYSAFECHFTDEIMRALELRLYSWCLSNHPADAKFICSVISGTNRMRSTTCRAECRARRMSGDMCTSLGNGFSNLMLTMFVIHEKGGVFNGLVEGDDGIIATDVVLTAEDYRRCGFTIKINRVASPLEAAFCGMTCSENYEVIKDPRRFMTSFGWTSSMIHAGDKVMSGLLRAKALSAVYEAHQCPIVGVLAREALRLTRGVVPKYIPDGYHTPPPDEMVIPDFAPSTSARLLMESKFGVSVSEQLLVEDLIREGRLDQVSSVVLPHPAMADYDMNYVETT